MLALGLADYYVLYHIAEVPSVHVRVLIFVKGFFLTIVGVAAVAGCLDRLAVGAQRNVAPELDARGGAAEEQAQDGG